MSASDITDAVLLDALSYPECYRGDVESCAKWAEANPDIYVMLRDRRTGRIVAYANIMPVTEECYLMIRRGGFVDVRILPRMILGYDTPGIYSVYFSSIVVHPDYRNSSTFMSLFSAVVSHFLELGRNGIFAKRLLADAVSEKGKKLCQLFGMKRLRQSCHGSELYEVNSMPR